LATSTGVTATKPQSLFGFLLAQTGSEDEKMVPIDLAAELRRGAVLFYDGLFLV